MSRTIATINTAVLKNENPPPFDGKKNEHGDDGHWSHYLSHAERPLYHLSYISLTFWHPNVVHVLLPYRTWFVLYRAFGLLGYFCVCDLVGRAPGETNLPQPTFDGIPLVGLHSKSRLSLRQPLARSQPRQLSNTHGAIPWKLLDETPPWTNCCTY